MHDFSNILRSLIEARGISQKWLADEAHTTEATISRYINGIHQPNVNLIIDIAKALDVSVDYLLGLTSMPNKKDDTNTELRLLVKCYNRASDHEKKTLWTLLEIHMTSNEKAALSLLSDHEKDQETKASGQA